jgi:hypothetical protein
MGNVGPSGSNRENERDGKPSMYFLTSVQIFEKYFNQFQHPVEMTSM